MFCPDLHYGVLVGPMGTMHGFDVAGVCDWEVREELLAFVYKPGGQVLKVRTV